MYAHVAPQQALPNQVGDKFIPVNYAVLDLKKLVTDLNESVELEKKGIQFCTARLVTIVCECQLGVRLLVWLSA